MFFKNFIKHMNVFKLDASNHITIINKKSKSSNRILVMIVLLVLATFFNVQISKVNEVKIHNMTSHIEYDLPVPPNLPGIANIKFMATRSQDGKPPVLALITSYK